MLQACKGADYYGHGLIDRRRPILLVAPEFNMTIHIQNVRSAGNMVEVRGIRCEMIVHDEDGALRLSAGGRVVDVCDEESLDALAQAINGAAFAIAMRRRNR